MRSCPLQGHEAGNHHSQQTNTETENQTLHVLTHKWKLNNENTWTQGGEISHTGACHRDGCLGEMPNVGEGEDGSRTHCHVCTYATILHDLHMYPKT